MATNMRASFARKSRSSFAMSQTATAPEKWHTPTLHGKKRFRAFVRKIFASLPWILKEDSDQLVKLDKQQPAAAAGTPHHTLGKQKKGISTEAKKILVKNQEARTPEEIEELIGYLGHLYFFNQYPKKEYDQLIAKSMLVAYGAGRVVIRQGHPIDLRSGLYCVITGNLIVEVETVDQITLHKTSEIVKKLGPGDTFGEAAILFNDLRESTVTTITPVQLILVTKFDFDAILKDSLEKEWSKVHNSMKQLPYFFGDWGDVEARRCSIISSLKSFKDGDGLGKEKEAHFVMEGKCSVVQNILVQPLQNGKFKLVPHKDKDKNSQPSQVQEIYMQTSIFTKGACFGVGENRENRRFVAESDVVCLMIPQYLLMAHKRFDSYKQYLESRLFSEQELFESFVYLRNRLNYRRKVIEGCKGRASEINKTTIWDVPYYYRVLSPQIGLCKVPENIIDGLTDSLLSANVAPNYQEKKEKVKRRIGKSKF